MVEKQRFFTDPAETTAKVPESEADLSSFRKADSSWRELREGETHLFVQDDDDDDHVQEIKYPHKRDSPELTRKIELPSKTRPLAEVGFELFRSQLLPVIGDASERDVRYLHKKYFNGPNYIRLASEEYFSGIVYPDGLTANTVVLLEADETKQRAHQPGHMKAVALTDSETKVASTWKRFIGTLDIEAWATRPYLKSLKYKQTLELRRLIPNKIKKSSLVAAKFGDSAIIRLYTTEKEGNREIGRVPEDITRILSPLIDLGIADFEASVIMETSGRLSIGDPFYLQIRCYLNSATFENPAMLIENEDTENSAKRRKTAKANSLNFAHESEAEAALRLKQKSISRLFDKLQLYPYDRSKPDDESDVIDVDSPAPETPSPLEELNLDQLKQFYTANQQSDYWEDLPETTTPPAENFKLQLRPYQKHGLSWMLALEKELDLLEALSTSEGEVMSSPRKQAIRNKDDGVMNPLWSTFRWPRDHLNDIENDEECFYANLYNGELSRKMPLVKNLLKGGVLADEMGLGKTILTLALIHSVPYDMDPSSEHQHYASKSTLIVVPMSLLSQWKNEFERSNNNLNHKCFVYYGETAMSDLPQILCNRFENIPIVVLTTYGTVQNEWTRMNKTRDANGKVQRTGLFSVEFFRVVLDEGHTIRNRNTKTAKSVYELELKRRWVLTGTPVVNRLDDIFSVVKFLKLDPWSNFSYWKTFVTLPFEQKKFNQTLDVVKSILAPIFLRRTKNMKQKNGQPLVDLPEKEVVIEELEFSKREQLFYDLFKSRAYQSFKEGMKSGDLLKKYTQILTHILRLRQVCCHTDLVASSLELEDSSTNELSSIDQPAEEERFASESESRDLMYSLYKKVRPEESECSICTQSPIPFSEIIVTPCGHLYCFHCLHEHIEYLNRNEAQATCPDCRAPISKYRLFKLRKREVSKKEVRFHTNETVDDPYDHYTFQLFHHDPDKSSTKIDALLKHLRLLKDQSPGEQVVVFSQFSSYLDIIEIALSSPSDGDNEEFLVYKFDGRLNMSEREKILKKFSGERSPDGKITVLLLSLKAGGVGLNLTCSSRAFMMDPWWSPSIEDQAIDRIHRIGQSQSVKVIRFIVKDSIETKMLRIQERKRMMGEAVEVEEEERRKQRIEEIKLLFDA